MDSTLQILDRMNKSGVPYVIIGGMAAVLHGSAVTTNDVDIYVLASDDHFRRIVKAFMDVQPCYRTRPDLPPLHPDHHWLSWLKNLYLKTDIGQLDILGEVPGVGDYNTVHEKVVEIDAAGIKCRVLEIPVLIASKRFANRPKDHRVIAELNVILKKLQESRGKP